METVEIWVHGRVFHMPAALYCWEQHDGGPSAPVWAPEAGIRFVAQGHGMVFIDVSAAWLEQHAQKWRP